MLKKKCTLYFVKCFSIRVRQFSVTHTRTSRITSNMNNLTYETMREDSREAFISGIAAVKPALLVQQCLQKNGGIVKIHDKEVALKGPCHVVGFGKAVLEMALETERILGESMVSGIVSVPVGTLSTQVIPPQSVTEVFEGARHNLPDEAAEETAQKILKLAQGLGENDTLLVLISGGGSALLPLPLPPVSLTEKLQVIKKIANSGGDIVELNCVRKRLSCVKGGRLAEAAHPANVIALILSDVIGDPLDYIASGPTVPNTDSPFAAWEVLCKFSLQESIPLSVKQILQSDVTVGNFHGGSITNVLIGTNTMALNAAQAVMSSKGYSTVILSSSIQGSVSSVSEFYAALSAEICNIMNGNESSASLSSLLTNSYLKNQLPQNVTNLIYNAIENAVEGKGVCIIAGGETTVKVNGRGVGGRNQELALRFAEKWAAFQKGFEHFKVLLMSAGTDGIDGPTDAAGAFGHAGQVKSQLDHKQYLANNDSYSFYSALNEGEDLIKIGHTGTNVMDIHMLVVHK